MGYLRDDEVRRLMAYLRRHIQEEEQLAEIEDILRSDEAEEYLREPELLEFFSEISGELLIQGIRWNLRIIPHAHLRIVQRGIPLALVNDIFRRFIDYSYMKGQLISTGPKKIIAPRAQGRAAVTLRVDVDEIQDGVWRAHVVTVIIGHTAPDEAMETATL